MPLYEYHCVSCGAGCEVILDSPDQKEMQLICMECGGVMKADAFASFFFRSGKPSDDGSEKAVPQKSSCGHGHHCRCAIKSRHPNPFQKEIDAALGNSGGEA